MWRDLKSQGFNEQLEPVTARGLVLSVHSENAVTVTELPFDAALSEEAIELPIIKDGYVDEFDGGRVIVNTLVCGGPSFIRLSVTRSFSVTHSRSMSALACGALIWARTTV
jgi:hypothetical protein